MSLFGGGARRGGGGAARGGGGGARGGGGRGGARRLLGKRKANGAGDLAQKNPFRFLSHFDT